MHSNLVYLFESPECPLREATNCLTLDSSSPAPRAVVLAKISELCEDWVKALGQHGSYSS